MSRNTKAGLILVVSVLLLTGLTSCGGSGEKFNPTSNTTLDAGEHHYAKFTVPQDVIVTLSGDVVLEVDGSVEIEGSITGDCVRVEIRTSKSLILDGHIQNTCSDEGALGKDVRLLAYRDITLGTTPSENPIIQSHGNVVISYLGGEDLEITPEYPEGGSARLQNVRVAHLAAPVQAGRGKTVINRPIILERAGGIYILDDAEGIEVNASFIAGDGQHGTINEGATCDALMDEGGFGGSIYLIAFEGDITINDAVTLRAGDGGDGGACEASEGCPSSATGGPGGLGGDIFIAASTISFGEQVVLEPGDGGNGGWARAHGKHGEGDCEAGCDAVAEGGDGGYGGYVGTSVIIKGTRVATESILGFPTIAKGNGGQGGWTFAVGGDGQGCSTCPAGDGGDGGDARSEGGRGGSIQSNNEILLIYELAPDTWQGGDGGEATANSSNGGAGATCCVPPKGGGMGGFGGSAIATGGEPGRGFEGQDGQEGATQRDFIGNGGDGGDGNLAGVGGEKGAWWSTNSDQRWYGFVGEDGEICKQPASFIAQIIASYEHLSGLSKVVFQILVLAADPEPLEGAEVEVVLTRPDETTERMSVTTDAEGLAEGAFDILVYGDYLLTIEDITAEGAIYDPALNIASSIPVNVTEVEGEAVFAADRILAFIEAFNGAFESEDATFLIESIHPGSIERYGDACPAFLESVLVNPVSVEVLEVTAFGPWNWVGDNLETLVENVYTILVNYTTEGQTTQPAIHLGLRPDASLGFFPDCGEPDTSNQ